MSKQRHLPEREARFTGGVQAEVTYRDGTSGTATLRLD